MIAEHRIQSVIAAFQCVTVISGSIAVASMLKAAGYPHARDSWPDLPVFIRDWGLMLLCVPLAWAFLTIWLERRDDYECPKAFVVISGLLLLAFLFCFFLIASAKAVARPIME